MTATGLQKYININLDGTKTYKVDISIYSPDPSQGVITTSEVMEASVESLTKIAGETLQDTHRDSIDRKSTRLNSSHVKRSRMPSSA